LNLHEKTKVGQEFVLRCKIFDKNGKTTRKYLTSHELHFSARLEIDGINVNTYFLRNPSRVGSDLTYEVQFDYIPVDGSKRAMVFEAPKMHFFHDIEEAKKYAELAKSCNLFSYI